MRVRAALKSTKTGLTLTRRKGKLTMPDARTGRQAYVPEVDAAYRSLRRRLSLLGDVEMVKAISPYLLCSLGWGSEPADYVNGLIKSIDRHGGEKPTQEAMTLAMYRNFENLLGALIEDADVHRRAVRYYNELLIGAAPTT